MLSARAVAALALLLLLLLLANSGRQPSERHVVRLRVQPTGSLRPATAAASAAATVPTPPPLSSPPLSSPPPPEPPPPPGPPPPRISMRPSPRFLGAFDVSIGGSAWLVAGGPIQVRHDGATFDSATRATGRRLSLVKNASTSGSDVLGSFERVAHTWRTDGGLVFETAARRYASALVFEQRFHTAASRTGGGGLVSSFPTFGLPAAPERPPRYFLQWDGDMAGQLAKAGAWVAGARVGGGLVGTAPLVVFSEDLRTSAVVSPLSSFMVAAAQPSHGAVAYGVLGSVASVPAGFGVETVVVASRGVREAMLSWGDALLRYHGAKRREAAWERDPTLRRLGYATDNGAYYYYNVHPDRGPPGTTARSKCALGEAIAVHQRLL